MEKWNGNEDKGTRKYRRTWIEIPAIVVAVVDVSVLEYGEDVKD